MHLAVEAGAESDEYEAVLALHACVRDVSPLLSPLLLLLLHVVSIVASMPESRHQDLTQRQRREPHSLPSCVGLARIDSLNDHHHEKIASNAWAQCSGGKLPGTC